MAPDIAILGGGPAGLALAAILERNNFSYTVYERSALHTPPRGGCLDLHVGSGQLAMQEAGCYDKFREFGRAGDATIHVVWNAAGEKLTTLHEGEDQPELDRDQIKQALLSVIPEEKVVWEKEVVEVRRNGDGEVVVRFKDGEELKGFKLVVGADGIWSHVRHLVCYFPLEVRWDEMLNL
jgi:2-polyprenyl-6-methoxyphenol hydroxylase-like FAD-dependent oxidoreductase